jgi:hypothetical protein
MYLAAFCCPFQRLTGRHYRQIDTDLQQHSDGCPKLELQEMWSGYFSQMCLVLSKQASDALDLEGRTASDVDDERRKSVKQMTVSFLRSYKAVQTFFSRRAFLNKV